MNLWSLLFNYLPIKRDKIVFYNFSHQYGCNPKYIAEEIIKQDLPYKLVWISKNTKCLLPSKIKLVSSSFQRNYELSTSKIIISNSRIGGYFRKGFKKKKGQVYIQTWHGSLGIKKMEADCDNLPMSYILSAQEDSKNIDYLISNSHWITQKFRTCFYYNNRILEIGNARNDIFFKDEKEIHQKVRNYFKIEDSVKIALYAPTFRNNKKMDCYQLDYKKVKEQLEKTFGGSWVIISRLHPNLRKKQNILPDYSYVFDGSSYMDIQELLYASNIMLTDYSSCVFDFLLSKKPAFIFATDIDDYNTERGFYYDLNTTPFQISNNNTELCRNITLFNNKEYQKKLSEFLKVKGCLDDGKASFRCVSLIKKIMERK